MKIIPSVLNWSYHHQFAGKWAESLDIYIGKVTAIKKKYNLGELGIDISIAGEQDVLKNHSKDEIAAVKKKIEDVGLIPIPIVGTLEIHTEPVVVEKSIHHLEQAMEEACALGADRVYFYHNLHGRLSREKAVRVFHEAAQKLNPLAEKMNLSMATENYCGFKSDELYLSFKDTPRVGLLNDIGNWLILGEDPIAVTKKYLAITNHLHLKDYIFEDGIWQSVPFGEGIVDLGRALDLLAKAPGNKVLFASLETDLDAGDEDEAMDKSFRYFTEWQQKRV